MPPGPDQQGNAKASHAPSKTSRTEKPVGAPKRWRARGEAGLPGRGWWEREAREAAWRRVWRRLMEARAMPRRIYGDHFQGLRPPSGGAAGSLIFLPPLCFENARGEEPGRLGLADSAPEVSGRLWTEDRSVRDHRGAAFHPLTWSFDLNQPLKGQESSVPWPRTNPRSSSGTPLRSAR